jgi:transposase
MRYSRRKKNGNLMKPYSIDFREKIIQIYQAGGISIRETAARFNVARSFVQKLLKQQAEQGHLQPAQQGGALKATLDGYPIQLKAMVEQHPDATLSEYCEYWGETYHQWVSSSTMCRALQKLNLTRKKRRSAAARPPQSGCKSFDVSTGNR